MAAKTQDAAGEAGEKYLRAALTPIVNDAMKRAQVRAQMPELPDSRPFVDAIVQLVEQTPLAKPRVQDDSLRAAAQGAWDAFKDFERYPRTVDGDRLKALAALRAALDKPPAAPTGETMVLREYDRKLVEVWGKEEHPHAVAYGWVRTQWDAALTAPAAQEGAAASEDTARLDELERVANAAGGIHLHNGSHTGCNGLGLAGTGRTLRQAVDAMRAARASVRRFAEVAATLPRGGADV